MHVQLHPIALQEKHLTQYAHCLRAQQSLSRGAYTTGPNGRSSDQLRERWFDQWNWLGDRRWTSVMRSPPKRAPLHDGWTDRHPAITQRSSTSNPRQSAVGNIAHGGPTSVLPTDGTQRKKQNGQWLEPSTFWSSPVGDLTTIPLCHGSLQVLTLTVANIFREKMYKSFFFWIFFCLLFYV